MSAKRRRCEITVVNTDTIPKGLAKHMESYSESGARQKVIEKILEEADVVC
jgi:hypothetical protein